MKKIKVALLGGYPLDTNSLRGGVQAAVSYLIKGLAALDGLELHALVTQPPGWKNSDPPNQNGVKVHFIPGYPRFERLHNYRRYQSVVNEVLSNIQPDIVHTQEAGAEALVALRSGFPTVVTAHGIRAEDSKYISSLTRRLRFYFDSYLTERSVINRVKYLVAISHYGTNYFSSRFRSDIDIRYIPNAVDDRFFDQVNMDIHSDILFVGRVINLKRVHDLVKAFEIIHQQIPQTKLHIAGEISSEPEYVQSIQAQIQQAGLQNQIHLLGQLNQVDLLQEYRNSALVVLPSAQENYPMVLAQAMAMGKPVIATHVGGVPEMVGVNGERGHLICVGDVNGLSVEIEKLLNNPEKRYLMGQAGHLYAHKNFHPDKVAHQTLDFYKYIFEKENGKHE